ncbi:hypothetical protein BD309DRAFT_533150 [Dichomitus squalens]|nr:hypothetical protein BD309DRAFT_533150 [Dichomitus squalens]
MAVTPLQYSFSLVTYPRCIINVFRLSGIYIILYMLRYLWRCLHCIVTLTVSCHILRLLRLDRNSIVCESSHPIDIYGVTSIVTFNHYNKIHPSI